MGAMCHVPKAGALPFQVVVLASKMGCCLKQLTSQLHTQFVNEIVAMETACKVDAFEVISALACLLCIEAPCIELSHRRA